MLRISKMSDYAVVLVSKMAGTSERLTLDDLVTATAVPLASVRKLMRLLTLAGICVGKKGAGGGYCLQRSASDISVLEVLEAVDGELALTQCAQQGDCECSLQPHCEVKHSWQVINGVIRRTLSQLSIADLSQSAHDGGQQLVHLLATDRSLMIHQDLN